MKLSRIGMDKEWILWANKKFSKYLGFNRNVLSMVDTDRELCYKIRSNFEMLGIECLLDYTMNIDDRLKIINDCFRKAKNNLP